MKRIPHITLLSILTFLLVITSCKDKDPVEKSYCDKNPGMCETVLEAKSYFAFKVGSWWVYEEETTHERDSIYVTEFADDPSSPDFDCYMYSEYQGFNFHFYPQYIASNKCSYSGVSTNKCIYIHRSKYAPQNFIDDDVCFFIQYRLGDKIPISNIDFPSDKLTISDILSEYSNNALSFGKTIKIAEDHTFIENNSPTYHYYAKGVGLVRKELIDSNQVWNLVSYHIEP
jgi:hypothetical protein